MTGSRSNAKTEKRQSEGLLRDGWPSRGHDLPVNETINDGLLTIDDTLAISYCNDSFATMLGYAAPELLGHVTTEFIDEAAREIITGKVKQRRRGMAGRYELNWRRRDGTIVPTLVSVRPIVDRQERYHGSISIITDLTDVKRTRLERDHLAAIVESAGDPIVGKDLNGVITSWNKGAERLYGYTAAEIIGQNVAVLAPPERKREISELIATVRRGGAVTRHETERVTKAGERVFLLITMSPMRDFDGTLVGISTIGHDITEHKRAEGKLQEVEQRYRLLFERACDGVMSLSPPAWRFTTANDAALEMFGVKSVGEFTALDPSQVSPEFQPDGQASSDKARAMMDRAMRSGSDLFEWEHRRLNGECFPAEVLLTRVESGGQTCLYAMVRDITERKRAERIAEETGRYTRSLIEASLDPFVVISPQGKITDVNAATVQATFVDRDQLLGTDFADYFTDRDKARTAYRSALEKGFVRDYPLSIRCRSGGTIDVLYNAAIYRNADGKPTGVFAAARDVTASKRAAEELQKYRVHLEQMVAARTADLGATNRQLDAANKELETFLYSVSHDLRAPLRAIDGFSHVLQEDYAGKLDAEGQRLFGLVRQGVAKMGQLIDDILAFSRARRTAMTRETVDMDLLVRTVLEDLKPGTAGRKFEVVIAPLPAATGDRTMLQRVWQNLLDNAIKYTAPKPEGRISVGAVQGEGETVYFVRDNGVGFDMKYVDRLFGVFERLHGAEFAGTGIGLAIVKRIIDRHGGRVWAEGKVDEGATVYFSLPMRPG